MRTKTCEEFAGDHFGYRVTRVGETRVRDSTQVAAKMTRLDSSRWANNSDSTRDSTLVTRDSTRIRVATRTTC